jgi:hypothetical protein
MSPPDRSIPVENPFVFLCGPDWYIPGLQVPFFKPNTRRPSFIFGGEECDDGAIATCTRELGSHGASVSERPHRLDELGCSGTGKSVGEVFLVNTLCTVHCVAEDLQVSVTKRVCSTFSGGSKLGYRLSYRIAVGILNGSSVVPVEGVEDSLGVPWAVKSGDDQVQCTQRLYAFRCHLYLAI